MSLLFLYSYSPFRIYFTTPCFSYNATKMERSVGWDRKNRGPVSQQVRHDKDLSLLRGCKCSVQAKSFAALHWQWWYLHNFSWANDSRADAKQQMNRKRKELPPPLSLPKKSSRFYKKLFRFKQYNWSVKDQPYLYLLIKITCIQKLKSLTKSLNPDTFDRWIKWEGFR